MTATETNMKQVGLIIPALLFLTLAPPVWHDSRGEIVIAAQSSSEQHEGHSAGQTKIDSSPEPDRGKMGHETMPHPEKKPLKTVLHPAEGASVKILSPKKGQVFKGDQIPIHFKLTKGKMGSHVHAYVDSELMGMFQSERGTLTGITPGRHTLEVRVVAKDHQTELDAVDRVEFVVK